MTKNIFIHGHFIHYDNLVDIIKERKWDKLTIGLEMDSHYFTAYCYEKMKQGLPNAKLKDSERLVNWARVVKSRCRDRTYEICSNNFSKRNANSN